MVMHVYDPKTAAQIATLTNDIADLRRAIGIPWIRPVPHDVAVDLYHALKALRESTTPQEFPAPEKFYAVVMTCTPESLYAIWETTDDPMPWIPFIYALRALAVAAPSPARDAAEHHVRHLALQLLHIQDLSLVEPDDLIEADPQRTRVLDAVLRRVT